MRLFGGFGDIVLRRAITAMSRQSLGYAAKGCLVVASIKIDYGVPAVAKMLPKETSTQAI